MFPLLYFYYVKSSINGTHLDGKKNDYLIQKPLRFVVTWFKVFVGQLECMYLHLGRLQKIPRNNWEINNVKVF